MHCPRVRNGAQAVFRSVPAGSSPWDCSFALSLVLSLPLLCESTSPGELLLELELLLPCVLEEFTDPEEPRGVPVPPVPPGWVPPLRPCAHADAPASHRITTSESTVTMDRFIMFLSSRMCSFPCKGHTNSRSEE